MMVKTNGCRRATRVFSCIAIVAAFMASFHAAPAQAAPGGVVDADAGTYTLTVDAGVTNAITADDVAAASGYALVKKGAGTLLSGADTAGFAGEIRIEEGILFVNDGGGLGTGAGGTVVSNGAALHLQYSAHDTLVFNAEKIAICGEGPDGNGAIYAAGSSRMRRVLGTGGALSLNGDARVGGSAQLGFGRGSLDLNGHTLTIAMGSPEGGVVPYDMQGCPTVATAGTIDLVRGRFFMDSSTSSWAGDGSGTLYVRSGMQLGFRSTEAPVPWSLVLEDNTLLYPSSGTIWSGTKNIWSGPVEVQGTTEVEYAGSNGGNTGVMLFGPVSGIGGFSIGSDTVLRLSCPTNSFTGGVTVQCNEGNLGGLVLDATGALPPKTSGSHTVNGGRVVLRGGNMDIPNFSFNRGVLSNAVAGTTANIGTLTKTGNRLFEIAGGVAVTNRLEVKSPSLGTDASGIRLVADMTGLSECNFISATTNFTPSKTEAQAEYTAFFGKLPNKMSAAELKAAAEKLLDELPNEVKDTPELAYRGWTAAESFNCTAYRGKFRLDGAANETVTFGVSVADTAAVWVDGSLVVKNMGSYQLTSGTCFVKLGEVTLAPGEHELLILLGHYGSSGYGPRQQTSSQYGVVWATAFGVGWHAGGIDYAAATNSSDFVAVTASTGNFTPRAIRGRTADYFEGHRPSFATLNVPAATGPIDLGDDLRDMPPYEVANLTGQPFITNGAMKVTNVWTVLANDLAIRPLTLAPDAGLNLSEATLTVDDYTALNRDTDGVTILEAANGATLSGMPSLPAERTRFWTIRRDTDASGTTFLRLVYRGGIRILIR